MKWIKASERLPEKDGNYFVKDVNGNKNAATFDTKYFYQRAGFHAVFEWLDESEEQSGERLVQIKQLLSNNDFLRRDLVEKDKEIERLQGLIEDAIKAGFYADEDEFLSLIVEDFKTKNNL